jgi:dienelactone hydrolase
MKSRPMFAERVLLAAIATALPLQQPGLASMRPGQLRGLDARADFLRMIDRPRVPLAAQTRVLPDSALYAAERFSFAAEAGERVPGVLLKAAATAGRRPVVIVLHGTGAKKEEQLPLLRTLAGRGFVAVAIDARYHGERARTASAIDEYTSALMEAYRTGKGRPYMYDTVWDTMRLIDYLERRTDVDPGRIGLMGLSKGGTETYLTAAVDPRVAAAVPIIGVQGFRWALDHDAWQSRAETFQTVVDAAAPGAGQDRVDASTARRFYARVAPGIDGQFDGPAMLPLIAPRPLLVINGDSDARTPLPGVLECVAAAQGAYKEAGAEDKFGLYLQPGAGHVFTPTGELVALDWLTAWLKP